MVPEYSNKIAVKVMFSESPRNLPIGIKIAEILGQI